MIKLKDVSFSYGKTEALKHVSLLEEEPIIAGLWGRNGAGKTTLMKLISGLEQQNQGTILIDGIVPYNNSSAMKHVTYMQENQPFSDLWNVNDALRFGSYFNENWDQQLADELIHLFELPRKKKISKFSKGMQTMIKITIGLASKAPVTVMDEPTNGLDAHMRKQFYDALLDTFEEHPRLILLSTHHIDEIEPLCEKIAIVDQRTITRYEETEQLKMQGIHVTGEAEAVRTIIGSSKILEERKLGNQLNVMIDEMYTETWKQRAKELGVTVEKAPLQDYLVNTTQKEVMRK
ncbi:ABC transporter ATP-binding protein [Bacillus sp. JCM 19041]|uniref:ATP-binding cassette domain-containing protein n=1 Tax=Bacillus sp. JCM 19041 TaxID=1460637 RepID=UPI0006D25BCC